MATQGIISIVKEDEVWFKCVAGCNGMTAKATAKQLKKLTDPTLEQVYDICVANDFGCNDCLVVQSKYNSKGVYNGTEELPDLYLENFNNAIFNPRWKYGTSPYTELIKDSNG